MFEKYVRNDIGGGPFFFLKLVLYTLNTKKGLIEMFSTQLKTRTRLEFSLDEDSKVREQYSI